MANNFKNIYDDYITSLNKNKLTASNEIQNANMRASQQMDNYLKSVGLQNSGLGQSQYANLASNTQRQLANSNMQYDQQIADAQVKQAQYQNQLATDRLNDYKDMIANGNLTSNEQTNLLNKLKETGDYDNNYLDDYLKAYGKNEFDDEFDRLTLLNQAGSITDKEYEDQINQLNIRKANSMLAKKEQESGSNNELSIDELGGSVKKYDVSKMSDTDIYAEIDAMGISKNARSGYRDYANNVLKKVKEGKYKDGDEVQLFPNGPKYIYKNGTLYRQ